ncbi:MAG: hypothetical protein V4733_10910 [Verrucomicrobiota bacterium]
MDWWNSLSGAHLFFWTVAIGATLFQILLFLGTMVGGGDFDHSADTDSMAAPGGAEAAVKFLSVRALAAFAVGFGWAGVLFVGEGRSLTAVIAIAILTGLIYTLMIWVIMRMMASMQEDGTLDFQNALGKNGKVYVTVPAARAGDGQVEIMLQGRLITALAVTDFAVALPPLAAITVIKVENNTLVVAPIH